MPAVCPGARAESTLSAVGRRGSRADRKTLVTACDIRALRKAIRARQVAFPSQVPIFDHLHRIDIQWRLVILYFVRGWSSKKLADRYGFTITRVQQLIRQWTLRAMMLGYVDRIPGEEECPAGGRESPAGVER